MSVNGSITHSVVTKLAIKCGSLTAPSQTLLAPNLVTGDSSGRTFNDTAGFHTYWADYQNSWYREIVANLGICGYAGASEPSA